MDKSQVRVGDRLPMPHTTYEVVVLELATCDGGHAVFRFKDPVLRLDSWAHVHEFTDPGPLPLEMPAKEDYL